MTGVAEVKIRYLENQNRVEWNQESKLKKIRLLQQKMVLFFHEVLHSLCDVLIPSRT